MRTCHRDEICQTAWNTVVLGLVLSLAVKGNSSIWWQTKMKVGENCITEKVNFLHPQRDQQLPACALVRQCFLKSNCPCYSPCFPSALACSDSVEKMPVLLLTGRSCPAQAGPAAAGTENLQRSVTWTACGQRWGLALLLAGKVPVRFPGWARHMCFTWLSWGWHRVESSDSSESWFVFLHPV